MKTVLLLLALLLTGTAQTSASEVLFDVSHRVIFHPTSDKPLGLKRFVALFDKAAVSEAPLSTERLKGVKALILPGAMTPYSDEEMKLIEGWVSEGGRLLVLLHIAPPMARLTERFGIILSNAVFSEEENLIGKSSQDFYARAITPHPLTNGVKEIALYGTWGLLAEGKAAAVAATSPRAWADFNRNRIRDAGEPQGAVGVVAATEYGKGRVVVVADDAPLANAFLDQGDNGVLASNIVAWLTR